MHWRSIILLFDWNYNRRILIKPLPFVNRLCYRVKKIDPHFLTNAVTIMEWNSSNFFLSTHQIDVLWMKTFSRYTWYFGIRCRPLDALEMWIRSTRMSCCYCCCCWCHMHSVRCPSPWMHGKVYYCWMCRRCPLRWNRLLNCPVWLSSTGSISQSMTMWTVSHLVLWLMTFYSAYHLWIIRNK